MYQLYLNKADMGDQVNRKRSLVSGWENRIVGGWRIAEGCGNPI